MQRLGNMADILSLRQLNRTLLARQHLLKRSTMAPAEMVAYLVGMQAQIPLAPYTGLWTRVAGFDPAAVGRMVASRELVRLPLMRGTLHLVTAEDASVDASHRAAGTDASADAEQPLWPGGGRHRHR